MEPYLELHFLPLIKNLEEHIQFPAKAKEILSKAAKYVKMKKGMVLLKEGTPCNELFFLNTGLIRTHYKNSNGNDVTSSFIQENEFFTNLKGFVNETDSSETISILEDSGFCRIDKNDYFGIMKKYPVLFYGSHQIINMHRIELEERIRILQNLTAQEKYQYFELNYPKLTNRVQLSYIASFLGIRLETLGRIRK